MTLSKDEGNPNLKTFNMSSVQMTNKSLPGKIQKDNDKLNIVKVFKKNNQ